LVLLVATIAENELNHEYSLMDVLPILLQEPKGQFNDFWYNSDVIHKTADHIALLGVYIT
jgi:hypothetical protein